MPRSFRSFKSNAFKQLNSNSSHHSSASQSQSQSSENRPKNKRNLNISVGVGNNYDVEQDSNDNGVFVVADDEVDDNDDYSAGKEILSPKSMLLSLGGSSDTVYAPLHRPKSPGSTSPAAAVDHAASATKRAAQAVANFFGSNKSSPGSPRVFNFEMVSDENDMDSSSHQLNE